MSISDANTSERDLDVAIAMIEELNRTIAAADTKSGLLLTAQGAVLAGVTAGLHPGVAVPDALRVLAVLTLVGVGIAVSLVVATLWPRLRAGTSRWFSFPTLRMVSDRPDAAGLAEDAWQQVVLLADIARRKHRCFRSALGFGGVAMALFLAWAAVAAMS